ncbi:MAG: neuraminidase-like domain-containing protein [Bacteroidota bacterium]|nr:neuraminidase-like domain-containing protein [Bacteroidota bacterium]
MPFDLSWEESKAYLEKIEINKALWMEAFRNDTTATPADEEVAGEYLGLSPTERDIITIPNAAAQTQFWGGLVDIDRVSVFLHKSQLEYKQLQELLRSKFVNPASDSKIVHTDTSCDTEQKKISNFTNDKLDRINRFLRLWRKTGLQMWELDKIIMNVKIGNGILDNNFLVQLKHFDELRKILYLKAEEALAYFGDLNIADNKSIYNKLFRNKVILEPLPDAFKTELVTENPFTNPAPVDRTISNQLKSLAAVLKLKEEEAAEIKTKSLADDNLSLSNISVFYRIASLTRKQKISTREYYVLLDILNTGAAFDVFASAGKTKEFLQIIKLIKASKFTIYELAYLLLHKEEGTRPFIPAEEKIIAFITKGREALQKIKDELEIMTGLPDEITKTFIGKISAIDEDAANQTIQIFNGSFSGSTVARDVLLDNIYSTFISTVSLKAKLNIRDAAPANQKDERTKEAYEEMNKLLIEFLQNDASRQVVIQLHIEQFRLAEDVCKAILNSLQLQGTAVPIIDHWFDVNLLDKNIAGNYIHSINNINFPNLFDSYKLLDKIALLQAKLPLQISLIELLISNAADFGIIKYNEIPISAPVVNSNFEKWREYVQLRQFNLLYPDNDDGSLAAVLKMLLPLAVTEADFLKSFAAYTGWDEAELTELKLQLGLAYPNDYKKPSACLHLDKCMNLLITVSIKASQIPLIINPAPLSADALAVKQLIKSKYDNVQWLNTSANIQASTLERKGIREKKRDALISYFTHHTVSGVSFKNTNELYSYYLLDVEMGSCEVTTRILQANLSIQLFVQRCLMNLEAEVIADETDDDGWKQWTWMKNYRVWEANRKVFLYPENWIEPELRLDKSYFFKELENDLMQNEINQQNVENAYLSYLEKLDNVGRLDVSGFYYEHETYTLHVFARTYDDPHLYYYRKWVEDRYWTPWEKLDLEINATHVIPLVINRRLYLYWPDFREKAIETNSTNVPDIKQSSFPIDKPYKYWEIRLAMSEFRNKKWTPKKISKTFATTATSQSLVSKDQFSFIPLDLLDIAGIDKYLIGCFGNSTPADQTNFSSYALDFFELGGCHGTPEILSDKSVIGLMNQPIIPQFERTELRFLESQEASNNPNDLLAYQQGNLFINHQGILQKTPGWFRNPVPSQLSFFDKILIWFYWAWIQALEKKNIKYGREWPFPYTTGTLLPFFYEDKKRTFFVLQQIILFEGRRNDTTNNTAGNIKIAELFYTDIVRIIEEFFRTGQLPDLIKPFFENGKKPGIAYRLKFTNFYHPYVCFLIKQLYKHGLDGMMKREVQLLDKIKFPELKDFSFKDVYDPTLLVNPGLPKPANPFPYYPKETIDFDAAGSYSGYNWELFFHAPLMLAVRLSKNQRFEEAQHWFHYIFNPTDTSSHPSPQKFWNTKPFFERDHQQYIDQRIDQILTMINSGDAELIKQVEDWRRNAFQPHLIAKFRTVAYQKTVVMKYLDNLIDWADNLYRSDRREAINEATQIYILAVEILGPKPMVIPRHIESPVLNYDQLEPKLDAFANAMINVENFIPFFETDIDDIDIAEPLPAIETFYYCIPKNDKLLEYWDKIGDRLFKIRHCMNIDGIERQLALFDPPIDPGLLVKAAASGISLGAALAGLNAPLPNYRFQIMVQKANEFCNEVKSLGGALLSALEKKDAEAMALLRSTHEIRMQEAVKAIRKKQIEEAKENIESLKKTKDITEEKKTYYSGLSYMNPAESLAFHLSKAASVLDISIAAGYILAGGLKAIPQFIAGGSGFGGSPHVTVDIGGVQFGDAAEIATKTISSISHALDKEASLASTQGSYLRRQEEWEFQKTLAIKELIQIDKQITVAEIRMAIVEKELENHELQIEQSKETKAFMESKFTNLELYNWMIGQISGLYFQAYQLAFYVAKKAERCYRFELGLSDSNFIQFGYWDSMKKGLLSGERLSLDIRRIESSYYDQNKREFEITKHISLSQIDPLALLALKQNGECFVNLPEEIFDLDYPGHYFRRIKSASISVPCIIGPYNNINCTLTLLKSRTRISPIATNVDYSTPPTENDLGFNFNFSSIQQIVTSNGQNDAGMFDVNLRDERYLAFEGHGAISEWKIEINKDFKNFDMDTMSDVILHIRYTARQGGKVLATKVKNELNNNFDQIIKTYDPNRTGFYKLISMKTEFPTELHRLLHSPAAPHKVDLNFGANNVPYWLSGKTLEFDGAADGQIMYIKPKTGEVVNVNPLTIQLNGQPVTFVPPVNFGELKTGTSTQSGSLFGTWAIDAGAVALDASKVEDILLLIKFNIV